MITTLTQRMTEDINPVSSRTKQKQLLEMRELHEVEIQKKEEDYLNRIEDHKKSNKELVSQKEKEISDLR